MALNLLVKERKWASETGVETFHANATEKSEEMRGFGREVKKRRIALEEEIAQQLLQWQRRNSCEKEQGTKALTISFCV